MPSLPLTPSPPSTSRAVIGKSRHVSGPFFKLRLILVVLKNMNWHCPMLVNVLPNPAVVDLSLSPSSDQHAEHPGQWESPHGFPAHLLKNVEQFKFLPL